MKITPIKTELQIESMDTDLRNGLWNVFDVFFLKTFEKNYDSGLEFLEKLYIHHLKLPIDEIPNLSYWRATLRSYFFGWAWYEVFDFVEFLAQEDSPKIHTYIAACNRILERELSGCRFIDRQITPITDETELSEIEEAIKISQETKLSGVNSHLRSSLSKLSDRKEPDYRNSIKESISAVESISQIIADNPKARLSQALKIIEDKVGLHPALTKGFLAIYGYTSDADGIRHAMIDESDCNFEDAKYMLVSCSAFINYLIMKAAKAGIL